MDVTLMASERIDFSYWKTGVAYGTGFSFLSGSVMASVGGGSDSSTASPSATSMLEKSLAKSCSFLKRIRLDDNVRNLGLLAEIVYLPNSSATPRRIAIKLCNKANEDNFFTRLERACGGFANLTFHMEFIFRPRLETIKIEAKELVMEIQHSLAFEGPANLISHQFDVTAEGYQNWRQVAETNGELTLRVKLSDAAFQALQMDNLEDSFSTCRAIRADAGSADALIVAGGGAEIRCHKGFLSAHSPVFKAMFESSMKEGVTSTVQLPDMTEAGVQALLDYLYCWDLKEIFKSSSIALELLVAADKYNIPRLQNSIQDLMLLKEDGWFTVPAAIQLLQFVKRMRAIAAGDEGQIYKSLETKCLAVLKSKSADELNECPEYQKLFEDPNVGKQFCTYVLCGQSSQ